MALSLIVAMDKNRVIGKENDLPWHLPEDLKYFKKVTMGAAIIMGRKTYDSIGRPLPGRENIVITRQANWKADGVTVFHALSDARDHVGQADAFIIGGAEIYNHALQYVDKMYITEVDIAVEGDAYFPIVDWPEWQEVSRDSHDAEDGRPAYSFVVYKRN
ncbi:dihydrofolate reductase [Kordiimonas sediminis]|uniref:Dihydrofolate reductase n=1 Tax=Kordiimonas sediminis TaxID=1735581 RepID=A0A919AZC0_9PROT|nr:dihydrofolate reductase [Kordiimonas sediminis]GHF30752.1 dihydrofolate reductase [Kordiimonas sediminis]